MAKRSFGLAVFTSVCLVAAAYHQKYAEKVEDSVQEESSQDGARMTKGRPSGYRDEGETSDYGQHSWRDDEASKYRQVQAAQGQQQKEYEQTYSSQSGRDMEYILHHGSPSMMGQHQSEHHQNSRHPQVNYDENPQQYHQQQYQQMPKVFKQEPMEHTKTFAKKPYALIAEKKVPYEVKVPVERPYPVYIPQPYPVYIEKKVPYGVEVPVPQPFAPEKKVPYEVKVPVGKPYPVLVEQPFPVFDKKAPFIFQKPFPYPAKVPLEKGYPMPVPEEKEVAQEEETFVQFPVKAHDEKPVLYPVERPQSFLGDEKVSYTLVKEVPLLSFGKSSQTAAVMEEDKKRGRFPQVGEHGGVSGGQEEGETASIAEMGEAPSPQELPKDQPAGSGVQEGYAAVQGETSMKQEKRQKLPIDVKRSVGKSFMHSSMETSGKKMSYSTAIDHY